MSTPAPPAAPVPKGRKKPNKVRLPAAERGKRQAVEAAAPVERRRPAKPNVVSVTFEDEVADPRRDDRHHHDNDNDNDDDNNNENNDHDNDHDDDIVKRTDTSSAPPLFDRVAALARLPGEISRAAQELAGMEFDDEPSLSANALALTLGAGGADASAAASPAAAAAAAAAAVVPRIVNPAVQAATTLITRQAASVPLGALGLASALEHALRHDGVAHVFPVQAVALPVIARARAFCCDVCVSSPTGSGKTLAYALPIINALLSRRVPTLRALVLLPTRDLATQVGAVLRRLAEAASASAQREATGGSGARRSRKRDAAAAEAESTSVVAAESASASASDPASAPASASAPAPVPAKSGRRAGAKATTAAVSASNTDLAALRVPATSPTASTAPTAPAPSFPLRVEVLLGSKSFAEEQARLFSPVPADIVVATPGRLVDHLNETPHLAAMLHTELRWLVVDEADRLVQQHYHDWLAKLLDVLPATPALLPERYCQKLLFSATLTHNPQKIAALRLNNPRFVSPASVQDALPQLKLAAAAAGLGTEAVAVSAGSSTAATAATATRYLLPERLTENIVVCPLPEKPLALAYLLQRFVLKQSLAPKPSVVAGGALGATGTAGSRRRNDGDDNDNDDDSNSSGSSGISNDNGAAQADVASVDMSSLSSSSSSSDDDSSSSRDDASSSSSSSDSDSLQSSSIATPTKTTSLTAHKTDTATTLVAAAGPPSQALCFCGSVESAHRLTLLLQFLQLQGLVVAEFSSSLSASKREELLAQFKQGRVHVLICSDVMARGLDLPEVEYVLNYDAPQHIKSYVHRVGRTARAGRSGSSFTLLRAEEVFHFRSMVLKAESARGKAKPPTQLHLPPRALYEPEQQRRYHSALQQLRLALAASGQELEAEFALAASAAAAGPVDASLPQNRRRKRAVAHAQATQAANDQLVLKTLRAQAAANFAMQRAAKGKK